MFKHFSLGILETLIRAICSLILSILVARTLGAELFGEYSYAQSIYFSAFAVLTIGLPRIFVKDVITKKVSFEMLAVNSALIKVVLLIVLLILCTLDMYFFHTGWINEYVIIALLCYIPFTLNSYTDILEGSSKFNELYLSKIISVVFSFTFRIIVLLAFDDISILLVGLFVENLILLVMNFKQTQKEKLVGRFEFFNINKKYIETSLKRSWPLAIASISTVIFMQTDQMMIRNILDAEALAPYAISFKLASTWNMIPMVIATLMFPQLVKSIASGMDWETDFRNLLRLTVLICILPVVGCYLFGDYIINILYGSEYHDAYGLLVVHSFIVVGSAVGILSARLCIALELQKKIFLISLLGAISNVVLNYILIQTYGAIGAAYATLFTQLVVASLGYLIFSETRNIFYIQCRSLLLFRAKT